MTQQPKQDKVIAIYNPCYIETIKASGCEVNELTADEIAALTEVMKPVHEKYRDVIGSDTLDKAYEIIDKYNK